MFRKLIPPLLFLLCAWFIITNLDARTIIAGIAIFLIGMHYMEQGFKLFSGGALETILERFTSSTPRAITTGFLATAVVQSSSLVSVIVISFLSAELIGLTQAVGVVFGSNIGTTTTAWLVSSLGLKIKIAHYALPMLTFGVIMQFARSPGYKGLGSVLIGLGFIFLGIDYMKTGFEALKEGLDLSQYAIGGVAGILVYVLLGAGATVIIQSSSATMAIVITALATAQIDYISALSLAIGANIGTTVTAILGALASNHNGKRLAVAHLIFNIVTGVVALLFIYPLRDLVDVLSPLIGIDQADYAMKLALFHTIFNVLGVLLVTPFMSPLVAYISTLFREGEKARGKPKYLTEEVMQLPATAVGALRKETVHLYDKALEAVLHAMNMHRSLVFSDMKTEEVVRRSKSTIRINIDETYQQELKSLYGEILRYASISLADMDEDNNQRIYELKLAARRIIESVKDVRELQKNLNYYMRSHNNVILEEYDWLRCQLVSVLRSINEVRLLEGEDEDSLTLLEVRRDLCQEEELAQNRRIDKLIRENRIDPRAGSSLINDIGFTHSICKKFLKTATTLWVQDPDVQQLADDYGHE